MNLSWQHIIADILLYEVGYIAAPNDTWCTDCDSVKTLPDVYTVFGNTTNNSMIVTGLEPETCYVFGVRVYYSMESGEWNTLPYYTTTVTSKLVSLHFHNYGHCKYCQ